MILSVDLPIELRSVDLLIAGAGDRAEIGTQRLNASVIEAYRIRVCNGVAICSLAGLREPGGQSANLLVERGVSLGDSDSGGRQISRRGTGCVAGRAQIVRRLVKDRRIVRHAQHRKDAGVLIEGVNPEQFVL